MDTPLIEIILWAGLAFFLWAMRDNLGNVEAEIEAAQALKTREIAALAKSRRFITPERVTEPIGRYRDAVIYHWMEFQGSQYQFDCIFPPENALILGPGQCYVAPGLIYVRREAS
jgi:hypothetical protein